MVVGCAFTRVLSGAHRVRRLGPCAAVLTIALIAAWAVADAQAAVVPLPRIKATTKEIRSGGGPAIVVRTLLVRRIHGKLTVRCNRCRRMVGRIGISRPSATSRRFTGVNWILRGGRAVKVTVVRRGRIGRYLLLTAQRRDGRLGLAYKESGCLNAYRNRVVCPRGTPPVQPDQVVQSNPAPSGPAPATPPVAPVPPGAPSAPAPPPAASTSDTYPCESPVSMSWSQEKVQRCPLVGPLPPNNWVPVYSRPVARAAGAGNPAPAGWLHGTANQYFVCQREFPGVEYYHPNGYRNRWWSYTLSDENVWGWTPQVFFQGGTDDEPDKGLAMCGPNHT
ncbi:MAG TPA: hypothetical protein VF526_10560 [Solirubrobacteraceae bacterium]